MAKKTVTTIVFTLAFGFALTSVASATCTVATNPRNGQPVIVCPNDDRQPGTGGTCDYQIDIATGQMVFVCT